MNLFDSEALPKLLENEGVYSNDPTDHGKETVFGISRNNYPHWPGWILVDQLKPQARIQGISLISMLKSSDKLKDLVSLFYKGVFWNHLHCDELDSQIALELFDTSVNMGKQYGVKCLQRALNKLNRNQKDYPDLNVDGGIGEETIKAYNAYIKTASFQSRNKESIIRWLLKWMNFFQLDRYNDITDLHPEQEKYIPGWTDRG